MNSDMSTGDEPRKSVKLIAELFQALVLALLLVFLASLLARYSYGLAYSTVGSAIDVLLLLPVLFLALRISGWWLPAAILGVVIVLFFILGHAVKISLLSTPVSFGDFRSAVELIRISSGWRLASFATLSLVLVAVPVWALWPRRNSLLPLVILFAYLIGSAIMVQLLPDDKRAGSVDQLKRFGGLSYVLGSFANFALGREGAPGRDTILGLLAEVQPLGKTKEFSRRNIHMILMEGMWDPLQLNAYTFSRDPFDPRMRALLNRSNNSSVLSPVFGGATANAEFEALCGLPAEGGGKVIFVDSLHNSVPCLPRVLRDAGYESVANHPNQSTFWNRDQAYARIGFNQYHPISAYKLDDIDGMFLNDRSMFFQTLERLKNLPKNQPLFAYIVSLSSHYPYSRNEDKRPDLLTVKPTAPLLQRYSNALAYSTGALMDYIEAVLETDPEAIIVAFGDHAPVLGNDPDPYAMSSFRIDGEFNDKDLARMSATPLLVIDGPRGPIDFGSLPLYLLPSKLVKLLGRAPPQLPQSAVFKQQDSYYRIFMGATLLGNRDGDWQVCHGEYGECGSAFKNLRSLRLLRDDLIRGDQHALQALGAVATGESDAMAIDETYGNCKLAVVDWGPRTSIENKTFNAQRSGKSALWIKVAEVRGKPKIFIGGDEAPVEFTGGLASALFADPVFLRHPGKHNVTYKCPDGNGGTLGSFDVQSVVIAPFIEVPKKAEPCRFDVTDWGPKTAVVSQTFNRQPDGSSAMWFAFDAVEGNPRIWIGDHEEAVPTLGQGVATISIPKPKFIRKAGSYDVAFRCGFQAAPVLIGKFTVAQ